ncbi:MAG: DNA cytosine methyltransferase [Boseongicola sp.]|nr:DNA cytosine methyltransferase [Boseongicola sp.]
MSDADANVHESVGDGYWVRKWPGAVVDIFCGAGGLSHGLRREGFRIAAGVDVDERCRYPFEQNNASTFLQEDVDDLDARAILDLFGDEDCKILVGCAPCQAFSLYNQKNNDPSWRLVERFAQLVDEIRPDVVSMENVPRLLKYEDGRVFNNLVRALEQSGYGVSYEVLHLPKYGLPQRRSRLVVIGSLHGKVEVERPALGEGSYATVEQAIGGLPPLAAGEADSKDALHKASRLSPLNLRRIRASLPGGSWTDWDEELVTECHRATTGKGYRSVYGRMRFDEPAPTITTQFYGFGNGRFGHPEQDRALSLREGAILQSFPRDYKFVRDGERVQFKRIGRLIGNAVPVLLGEVIGRAIGRHFVTLGIDTLHEAKHAVAGETTPRADGCT